MSIFLAAAARCCRPADAAHAASAAADGRARGAQEQGEEGRTVQTGQFSILEINLPIVE